VKLIERFKIAIVSALGYWTIRSIGATLRWKVLGWEHFESGHEAGRRNILVIWHGRMVPAAYYLKGRGIVVMASRNRDGEYMTRVIQRLGYGVARGSSSKGCFSGTLQTVRALNDGNDVCLTVDGPRGPRYVAKPGAAWLAWKTGNPVVPYVVSCKKKWTMNSWDHFQIPKPFTQAIFIVGEPVYVPEGAIREDLHVYEDRIQHALDDLRNRGDHWWGRKHEKDRAGA
jgi:lysophospholipid acyltransferase (LPLAT)-like uncharacterized protein